MKNLFPAHDAPSKAAARRALRRLFNGIGRVYVRLGKLQARKSDILGTILPPAEDAAVISSWIDSQYTLADDLFGSGRALKRNRLNGLTVYADALVTDRKASDQLVAGFGFKQCVVEPNQRLPSL